MLPHWSREDLSLKPGVYVMLPHSVGCQWPILKDVTWSTFLSLKIKETSNIKSMMMHSLHDIRSSID